MAPAPVSCPPTRGSLGGATVLSSGSEELQGVAQCSPRAGDSPSRSPSPIAERGTPVTAPPPPSADPVSRDTPSLLSLGSAQGGRGSFLEARIQPRLCTHPGKGGRRCPRVLLVFLPSAPREQMAYDPTLSLTLANLKVLSYSYSQPVAACLASALLFVLELGERGRREAGPPFF